MTRKTWSLILFLLVLLFPAAPAFARISGLFSGRIVVIDRREARPASTVCESGILPCTVPVRRAIVSVSVRNAEMNRDPGSDCCEVASQTFWKQTDDNGMFDISWEDVTRDEFPVELRITVHWFSTTGNIISTTRHDAPSNIAFVIEGPGGERLSESISIAGVQATNPRFQFSAQASDESQAYLTLSEVFRRIVRWSNLLEDRMRGISVRTRIPNFDFRFGVAPFDDLVLISEDTPIDRPDILAHEVGHVITWNALDVHEARVGPLDYSGTSWCSSCCERERAAFLEGMADFWSLVWQFEMTDDSSTVRHFKSDRTFNFELATVTRNSDGDVRVDCRNPDFDCDASVVPFCHTATLWDLYDANGSDGVRMSVANIVKTLNRFDNGCIFNGCTEELGDGGVNHHDFRRRIRPTSVRNTATTIYNSNGLGGGSN